MAVFFFKTLTENTLKSKFKTLHARIRFCLAVLLVPLLTTCLAASMESPETPKEWTPDSPDFRAFYGWNDELGEWRMELLRASTEPAIALHTFTPKTDAPCAGTLFLLHGYLEHTALRVPLAAAGVSRNWLVAGYDLPGHGLSGGSPSTVASFAEYREAFDRVLRSRDWPKPWRVIAHSTGCTSALMYVQQNGNPFELVIMEAPLLRSYRWKLSMATLRVASLFKKTLPRRVGGIAKDQTLYKLIKKDPLSPDKMPISWCFALRDFVGTLDAWEPMEGEFIVMQGENDTVVDGAYNIPFLRERLSSLEAITIPEGTHVLLRHESPAGDRARAIVERSWSRE